MIVKGHINHQSLNDVRVNIHISYLKLLMSALLISLYGFVGHCELLFPFSFVYKMLDFPFYAHLI